MIFYDYLLLSCLSSPFSVRHLEMLAFMSTMGEVVHIHAVKKLVHHFHKARCSLNGVPFVVQIIPFYTFKEGMIYDVLGIGN